MRGAKISELKELQASDSKKGAKSKSLCRFGAICP